MFSIGGRDTRSVRGKGGRERSAQKKNLGPLEGGGRDLRHDRLTYVGPVIFEKLSI